MKPLISDECLSEVRAIAIYEEIEQKKKILKEEVYSMSKNALRKELLRYKYCEIEGSLLSGGLNGLKDF